MTNDIIRQEFERITEFLYEGDFHKYDSGDYINEVQQYQWEGFHDGWKAAIKFSIAMLNDKLIEEK